MPSIKLKFDLKILDEESSNQNKTWTNYDKLEGAPSSLTLESPVGEGQAHRKDYCNKSVVPIAPWVKGDRYVCSAHSL